MSDKLSPETSARLLRAKAAELEQLVLADAEHGINEHRARERVMDLTADVALLFSLIADNVERGIAERGPLVPIGDPLFNADGSPWSAES